MPLHAGVPGALPDGGVIRETKDQAFDGGGKHHVPEGKNDEYKKTWGKKPFRPFAFRFFTPSLLFAPIKIVLF